MPVKLVAHCHFPQALLLCCGHFAMNSQQRPVLGRVGAVYYYSRAPMLPDLQFASVSVFQEEIKINLCTQSIADAVHSNLHMLHQHQSINVPQEVKVKTHFLKLQLPYLCLCVEEGGGGSSKEKGIKSQVVHFPGLHPLSVIYSCKLIMKYSPVLKVRKFKQRLVSMFCDLSI